MLTATLWLIQTCSALSSDWGPRRMSELLESANLVVTVELKPAGEKLKVKIERALKGELPPALKIEPLISASREEGRERHYASFRQDAVIWLDQLFDSNRRVLFLVVDPMRQAHAFHPACVQPAEAADRVSELLAMGMNPAPFVAAPKYVEDLDLIYLIGARFFAFHVSSPAIPGLQGFNRPDGFLEEIPWQHTRFVARFIFDSTRSPMVSLEPLAAAGVLPDFVRKLDAFHAFDHSAKSAIKTLPAQFEVTVNTNGPEKVGDLTFALAGEFLRSKLQSPNLEVVEAAYTALSGMMDSDAVPIAIVMLKHPDRKFQREAAKFLSYAKDPRSIDPLCDALDALPTCVRYAREGYDQDVNQLSDAVGRAVRNIRDPKTIPALKRAAFKGYAGDWIGMTLSWLGDESAFEPLLSHLRNPDVDHYPNELVSMVQRSNLPVEDWMKQGLSSDDYVGKRRRAAQWITWWETNKEKFRIVRTWEEASRKPSQ